MKTTDEINKLLSGRRSAEDFYPDTIIENFNETLNKVRITDNLFTSKRTRKDYYNRENTIVGCSQDNLNSLNETAFSRALFNNHCFTINEELTITLDYEVTLSEGNKQHVDLIAYKPTSNALVAIEYKSNPNVQNCGIEYGLLESYCYGYLLNKILAADNRNTVVENIKKLDHYNKYIKSMTRNFWNNLKVEVILSGPVSYFLEFTKDGKKSKNRMNRILKLETAIRDAQKNTNSYFVGYLLHSEVSKNRSAIINLPGKNNSIRFPMMSYLFNSINDIQGNIIELNTKNKSTKMEFHNDLP